MEPTSLTAVYVMLAALGIISADSYINSDAIHLKTTVADSVKQYGYDQPVVDAIFMSEITSILNTPTLVAKPRIQSGTEKPFSTAAAEYIKMEHALMAIQSYVGLEPPRLTASIVIDETDKEVGDIKQSNGPLPQHKTGPKEEVRMLISGYDPGRGFFEFVAAKKEKNIDAMIKSAARQAVRQLDPYLATLAWFNQQVAAGMPPEQLRAYVVEQIKEEPITPVSPDRALFENLVGIADLLNNDPLKAREWFQEATISDPDNPAGWLNLAFLDVQEDRFEDALARTEQVIYPSYWPLTENKKVLATGHTIRGTALGELNRYEEAEEAFQKAIELNPQTSSAHIYWARMLKEQGKAAEAQKHMDLARAHQGQFRTYPELAMLYFWLTKEGERTLRRRLGEVEDH